MHSPTALMASPLEEEDISRAGVFHEDTASNSPERLPGRRGKQKQRAQDPFNDDGTASLSDGDDGGGESYPPTKDDVTESRRIEEVCVIRSLSGCGRSRRNLSSTEPTTMGAGRAGAEAVCARLTVVRGDIISGQRRHAASKSTMV